MSDVTQILSAIERGDQQASEKLLPLVYEELRKLAAARMARESPDHTLQATALVHEAYIRLVGAVDGREWDGRAHFFAAAAEDMRRILVENARRKNSVKQGGGIVRQELNESQIAAPLPSEQLLMLDEALETLAKDNPVKAELVKLRFFAGLSIDEAAKILDISRATAKRHWVYARAWLYGQISPADQSSAD
jgi:RNA polymerase sigma factor (TIGR02999 family)